MDWSVFDLHCDTAYELYAMPCELKANTLAVSLQQAKNFQRYIQVMALWCPPSLTDEEGWQYVLNMFHHLQTDASVVERHALLCPPNSWNAPPTISLLLLSLEDARILNGQLDRLQQLHGIGIRIFTPLWRGHSCIGGAYDTHDGLTEFGRRAVIQAVKLGMIPDISHASEQSAEELFAIATDLQRPIIASHSNVASVCPSPRNLSDIQIQRILSSDGIIGLNLCTHFLSSGTSATFKDILCHIEAFLERGATNALCLGCDMDGAPLPQDCCNISMLPNLAEELLKQNYTEQQVRAIFFENAYRFATKYIRF